MSEWHDYHVNNRTFCQKCKDLYDLHKDEDGQLEDYHIIIVLCEKKIFDVNKNKSNKKERRYTATLSDLKNGVNVRFNPDYKGLSQKDAYEIISDDDEIVENKN